VGAFKTVVSKARMMSGRGCDEADASGQLARAEEGGVVAASREGDSDGDLAFGRRKERWVGLDQIGPDEAGLVREERWTRLQESLGRNRFGPPEK
jgi:hypothetical protein